MKYFGFIFNEERKKLRLVYYIAEMTPYCVIKFVKYLIKKEKTADFDVWLFPSEKFISEFGSISEIIEDNIHKRKHPLEILISSTCDIIENLFNKDYVNNTFFMIESAEKIENKVFNIRKILIVYKEIKIDVNPVTQALFPQIKIAFIINTSFDYIKECTYEYRDEYYKVYDRPIEFIKKFKSFNELADYIFKCGKVKRYW